MLTEKLKSLFKTYVYQDYDKNEAFLPSGCCEGCRTRLNSQKTSKPRDLNVVKNIDYNGLVGNVQVALSTRSKSGQGCLCKICQTASLTGYNHKGPKRKNEPGPRFVSNDPISSESFSTSAEAFKVPGPPPSSSHSTTTSSINVEPDSFTSLSLEASEVDSFDNDTSEDSSRGSSRLSKESSSTSKKSASTSMISSGDLCKICLGDITRGKHNNCGSQSQRQKNLENLLTEKECEQITAHTLKKKFASADPTKKSIRLATKRGPSMEVTTPQAAKEKYEVPVEFFTTAMSKLGLSKNSTLTLGGIFKSKAKGTTVPDHLGSKLDAILSRMEDFFVVEKHYFNVNPKRDAAEKKERKKKELVPEERWVVRVTDMTALLDYLVEQRCLSNDVTLKIGMDSGQGFLKVAIVLKEKNTRFDWEEDPTKSPFKKKIARDPKPGGVKRVIVIGMVEDVPETFENVQILLNILNIKQNHINTTFASDLKLLNILIGIQGHSSNHACCYCTILTGARTDGAYAGYAEARTFGNLKSSYQEFVANGSNLKKARDFDSVIHPAILKGDSDEQKVLHKAPPPELHLYIGNVNKIIDVLHEETAELKDQDMIEMTLYEWLHISPRNVVREEYYGNMLNGPNCDKVLRKETLQAMMEFLPEDLQKFVIALKALNKMKKACFSTRPLDWTVGADWEFKWKSSIDGYVSAFLDLGIQRFPKFHIVEKHVAEFIEFTRQPLGNFSKQEFEALHSNFKPTWQRF